MYLNRELTREFSDGLDKCFEKKVNVAKGRSGKIQQIESLMNEEAFLLAGYLRNEKKEWNPRIVNP